jgi:molybdenum cofactor cytidylyltransferase
VNSATIQPILLAAGVARRFGADKLSARFGTSPENAHSVGVSSLLSLVEGCATCPAAAQPIVVMRASMVPSALSEAYAHAGARVLACADAHEGMGASVRAAVGASTGASAWLIALADMPRVRPATFTRLLSALAEGAPLVAPTFGGARGNPVGLSAAFREALLALQGDQGARAIVKAHAAQLQLIDCDDPGVLADIDTPEDLARLATG